MEQFSLEFITNFKVILTGLFVFVLVYAILNKIQVFGEKKEAINMLLAFFSAAFTLFSGAIVYVLEFGTNIFLILLIIMFLIFVIISFMGIESKVIFEFFTQHKKIVLIILSLFFIFILFRGVFFAFENTNPSNNYEQTNNIEEVNSNKNDDNSNFLENINPEVFFMVIFFLTLIISLFFIS